MKAMTVFGPGPELAVKYQMGSCLAVSRNQDGKDDKKCFSKHTAGIRFR